MPWNVQSRRYGSAWLVLWRKAALSAPPSESTLVWSRSRRTFVGKGTVPEFIEDLEHEATVYARLRPVYGKCVPVFLEIVELRAVSRTYY